MGIVTIFKFLYSHYSNNIYQWQDLSTTFLPFFQRKFLRLYKPTIETEKKMYKKSKELTEIIRKVNILSAEEQLSLISYLTNRLKMCEIKKKSGRDWTDLEGIAPNLLEGMDAQEYVTRMRRGEFPELEIQQKKLGN